MIVKRLACGYILLVGLNLWVPASCLAAKVRASGCVVYQQAETLQHIPASFVTVQLWDKDTFSSDDFQGATLTDSNGCWSIQSAQDLDTDENGTLDLYVIVRLETTKRRIEDYSNGRVYTFQSITHDNIVSTDFDFGVIDVFSDFYFNYAVIIFQTLYDGWSFAPTDPGPITLVYPSDFGPGYSQTTRKVYLPIGFETRPHAILHEQAHGIMHNLYGFVPGPAVADHELTKTSGKELAWSEGWASFYALAVTGSSCLKAYTSPCINLETPTYGTPGWDDGDDVEGRIIGALWDIIDAANDGYDISQEAFSIIWNRIKAHADNTLSDFWAGLNSGNRGRMVSALYQNTIKYNTPPDMRSLPDQYLLMNSPLNDAIDLRANASDNESTPTELTYSILGVSDFNCGVSLDGNSRVDISPAVNWTGFCDITVQASDGIATDRDTFRVIVNRESPNNSDPTLSRGAVDPGSGNLTTVFTFTVKYFDLDGDAPVTKNVILGGTAFSMAKAYGTASDGVYSYGPVTLAEGNHSFKFFFQDGRGGQSYFPSEGALPGPAVSPSVIDTSPPSPNRLLTSAHSTSTLSFAIVEAGDETPPVYYQIEGEYDAEGVWVNNAGGVSSMPKSLYQSDWFWFDEQLTANGRYRYRQIVTDSANPPNISTSPWLEIYTDCPEPTGFQITASSACATMRVDRFPNDSLTDSAYYFFFWDGGPGGSSSGWQKGNNTYTDCGLRTNTSYTYKVTYRNGIRNQALTFAEQSIVTQSSSTPNSPPTSPVISGHNIGLVGISYRFSATAHDSDDSSIRFSWDWGNGEPMEWTSYVSSGTVLESTHTWSQPGTFAVSVFAQDANGEVSQASSQSIDISTPLVEQITHNITNDIAYPSPTGEIRLHIPSNTFSEEVNMSIMIPGDTLPPTATTMKGSNVGIEITLDKQIQPTRDVTIAISYRDSDVVGMDESKLVIARYDTASVTWIPLSSTPDPPNNKVTATTNHFSLFQVVQLLAQDNLSSIKIFPHPFRPALGHTVMNFTNLTAGAKLKIYSLLGVKLKELTADNAGTTAWDGTNDWGQKVATGVYLVRIEGNGEKKTVKVAIQR